MLNKIDVLAAALLLAVLTAYRRYRETAGAAADYRETAGPAAERAGDSLVLYSRDTCPYCVKFRPTFDNVVKATGIEYRVVDTGTQAGSSEAQQNGVQTVPTVIAYRSGVEHKRYTGDDADKFVIDHAQ